MRDQAGKKRGASHKIQVWIALIGLAGVIATGVLTNWDKIFGARPRPPDEGRPASEKSPIETSEEGGPQDRGKDPGKDTAPERVPDPGGQLALFRTGNLVLRDWFAGDSGWELPPSDGANSYSAKIGNGRFVAQLRKPLSAGWGTAWRKLPQPLNGDFVIETTAKTDANAGFGVCWQSQDQSTEYLFYIYQWPRMSEGGYLLSREESWLEPGKGRYGASVNVLRPTDKQMSAIRSEKVRHSASSCTIAAICSEDTVTLYYNGQLLDQGRYTSIPVNKVGIFIAGDSRVEFLDFAVRTR